MQEAAAKCPEFGRDVAYLIVVVKMKYTRERKAIDNKTFKFCVDLKLYISP